MSKEIELDMRNREPPEPLFATLDAIDDAKPGDVITLWIHREPLMLYPHLQQKNIPWVIEQFGTPDWVLRIGPVPGQRQPGNNGHH